MYKAIPVFVVILLVVCLPVMVFAAPQPAPSGVQFLPVYTGSTINMETNLTDKDFLPIIRQWMTMIPSIMTMAMKTDENASQAVSSDPNLQALANACSEESLKELDNAISGLKLVSTIQYTLPGSTDTAKVADYYMLKLGLSKGWVQTLRIEDPRGTMRIYTKPNFESLFGFVITGNKVTSFRTEGKIDLAVISKWATKVLPLMFTTFKTSTIEEPAQTAQPEQPAPQAAPAQ